MADDDQDAQTRAQREAALKDRVSVFNKISRNLNKINREIHSVFEDPDFDPNELKEYSDKYKSFLEELSDVYDRILELSFDSPPPKVAETYERIDVDSCKFLSEVSAQIRDRRSQVSLNQSRVEEKVSSQIDQEEAITKLCS